MSDEYFDNSRENKKYIRLVQVREKLKKDLFLIEIIFSYLAYFPFYCIKYAGIGVFIEPYYGSVKFSMGNMVNIPDGIDRN